jgi:hypothetical protein
MIAYIGTGLRIKLRNSSKCYSVLHAPERRGSVAMELFNGNGVTETVVTGERLDGGRALVEIDR